MEEKTGALNVRVREVLCDEVSSLCLVRKCEELEEAMMTSYTLTREVTRPTNMKEEVQKNDSLRL